MDKNKTIFDFIIHFKRYNDGNSPSMDEIASGCDMAKTTAWYHLNKLEETGLLSFEHIGKRRSINRITVAGGEWHWLGEEIFPPS